MLTPYKSMLFLLLTAIIISTIGGQLKKIDAISNTIEAVPKKDVIASIKNKCGGKREMVFILDSSGSVGTQNFQTMLNTAANIAHHFKIGSQYTQVGLDRFSSTTKTMIKLNQWNNWFALQMKIKQIPYIPGLTYTWLALDHARTESFTESYGARPGIPKIAIVMTDGRSQNKTKTCEAAKRLRDSGVKVFAIGIGNIDWSEIICITLDGFRIRVNNFSALKSKSFRKRIANEACSRMFIIIMNLKNKFTIHGSEWKQIAKSAECLLFERSNQLIFSVLKNGRCQEATSFNLLFRCYKIDSFFNSSIRY